MRDYPTLHLSNGTTIVLLFNTSVTVGVLGLFLHFSSHATTELAENIQNAIRKLTH